MRSISHLRLSLTFACVVTPALGAQSVVDPVGRYADVARTMSALIAHERAQKDIPAISVALVDGQRVVWAQGFGWADSSGGVAANAQTVYRVGSVSKLFTDLAIMKLVET